MDAGSPGMRKSIRKTTTDVSRTVGIANARRFRMYFAIRVGLLPRRLGGDRAAARRRPRVASALRQGPGVRGLGRSVGPRGASVPGVGALIKLGSPGSLPAEPRVVEKYVRGGPVQDRAHHLPLLDRKDVQRVGKEDHDRFLDRK